MKNRRQEILNYIKTHTQKLINEGSLDNNGVEAQNIALDLKIDRANISRELNNLWKDGSLIKIAGRPVFYLESSCLRSSFPNADIPSFIPKESVISDYLKTESFRNDINNKLDISNMIGANGSLSDQIERAKAAVSYPPYGLHTLISGNNGTEKIQLANNMIEYAISNNIKKKNCPYYEIDCRSSGADVLDFQTKLFGYYDDENDNKKRGILEKCTDGFVILDGVEYLPESTLNLISSLLNKKYYFRVNSNTQIPLKCMLIITTSLPFNDEKIKPISIYTSVNINLTDLDNRGTYEKIEMILNIFSNESKNIGKTIRVSKDVIMCFASKTHEKNISQLENEIQSTCSKAYLDSVNNNKQITVSLYHLPNEITEMTQQQFTSNSKMSASMLLNKIGQDYIVFDENGRSEAYDKFSKLPNESAKHLLTQFIDEFNIDSNSLESLEDYAKESLNVIKDLNDVQLKEFKNNINDSINKIFMDVIHKYPEYNILSRHEELLYGILLHITNAISRNDDYVDNNQHIVSDVLYPKEYDVAKEIYTKLQNKFNIKTNIKEIDMLAVYLSTTTQLLNENTPILVIAHGESIASQMVEYVKKHCNKDIAIDAIDFNDSMQLNDCMELACVKAYELNKGAGIIVYVDKEPLTTIDDHIFKQTGISAHTLYPLTIDGLLQLVQNNSFMMTGFNNLSQRDIKVDIPDPVRADFINNLVNKVIVNTCTFIDPYKGINVLYDCLNRTLKLLNITYSDDIAVKYVCHCINMLERVIKNQPWTNNSLNKFIANNSLLMKNVEKGFELANNTFGIKIPQTELVYVAEIFLPYIN